MSTTTQLTAPGYPDNRREMILEKSDIIMTKESNPVAMAVCYAQGWCAHENYMTKKEAGVVTRFPGNLFQNTDLVSFDEFRFFTKLQNTGIDPGGSGKLFYYAQKLQNVTFPDQLTSTRGFTFRFAFRTSTYPFRRIIIGSGCTTIGSDSFYQWTDGEANSRTCKQIIICKATTPPTVSATRNGALSIVHLYVPDGSVTAYQNNSMWGTARSINALSNCPSEYLKYEGLIKD